MSLERYKLPIPWDAVPVSHEPPYRRFDPKVPQGYPKSIPWNEVELDKRSPDPHKYTWDPFGARWLLKPEFQ
jgi:hypothetical protein